MTPGVEPIANQIIAGVIVAIVGAIATYLVGKRSGRKEYEQLLERLDTTVYGQDGVEQIKGLAEIASSHEDRIEENTRKMAQAHKKLEEMEEELDEVREMIEEVKDRCERNNSEK